MLRIVDIGGSVTRRRLRELVAPRPRAPSPPPSRGRDGSCRRPSARALPGWIRHNPDPAQSHASRPVARARLSVPRRGSRPGYARRAVPRSRRAPNPRPGNAEPRVSQLRARAQTSSDFVPVRRQLTTLARKVGARNGRQARRTFFASVKKHRRVLCDARYAIVVAPASRRHGPVSGASASPMPYERSTIIERFDDIVYERLLFGVLLTLRAVGARSFAPSPSSTTFH